MASLSSKRESNIVGHSRTIFVSAGTPKNSMRRQWRRRLLFRIALLAITMFASSEISAQPPGNAVINTRREFNVKAVNLYGFCKFTTWPTSSFESADSELRVGVIGKSPILEPLRQIAEKKAVNRRKILVLEIDTPDDATGCHVVFVSRNVSVATQEQIVQATRTLPVFLVGERAGFGAEGAVANFFVSGPNIRFELNSAAAESRNIRLDAKLLSLGTAIRK